MKRIAIPKKEINEAGYLYSGDCIGVTLYLQIDPSQKWTITNVGGGYVVLAKKGQRIRLTYTAFNRLFDEITDHPTEKGGVKE